MFSQCWFVFFSFSFCTTFLIYQFRTSVTLPGHKTSSNSLADSDYHFLFSLILRFYILREMWRFIRNYHFLRKEKQYNLGLVWIKLLSIYIRNIIGRQNVLSLLHKLKLVYVKFKMIFLKKLNDIVNFNLQRKFILFYLLIF